MKQILIFGVFSLLLLVACKYSDIPKHIEVRKHLELDYAPYLNKTEDLHPNAIVGLQNKYRDVYYIVVPQKWSEDSAYVYYLFDSLSNDLKNIKKAEQGLHEVLVLRDTSYHNDKGYFVQNILLTGVLNEKKLIFNMQLIQKDKTLFQSSGWCFWSKRDLWMKDIDAMNQSIRILDGVK
ncbi:MAG: hypothetical protein LC105_06800 [Chitinophagales bacterium]|nr:hypothetical protein [Chitinophagales bacterium]MCZ2393545.1 hypothetical protein [Chitinophagales bacterium]